MTERAGADTGVLVVGAGPTGLVLALWLTRMGVQVKIVDRNAAPLTTSRAVAVQARTLELYAQAGLADAVVERGRRATAVSMWVAKKRVARAVFADMGAGISPYAYALVYPQDEHERLLIERLAQVGVNVERGTELVDFSDADRGVVARLKRPGGAVEPCRAAYIAGCDGAHSAVRETLRIGFPGGTYAHLFYVADVEATGPAINGEVHVAFDPTDFLAVFPLKRDGHARLVGTVRQEPSDDAELSWDDVGTRVIDWMQLEVARVNWFSTYRVHHRVAERFRAGRAFLLGDAAHIHSPVGGQGMNTGIGDAVNLAWKLAAVLKGAAGAAILDTYEPERIAFARRLVATTDRAFTAVTSSSALARTLRLRVAPRLVPPLASFRAVRRFLFRTVSQTRINYRGSALSEGQAGAVRGGDRLPWVRISERANGGDNFAPLASLDWQAHVYGSATPAVRHACEARRLPLHEFAWVPPMAAGGLQRDALYLVRPDGYVALAAGDDGAARLGAYLDRRGLAFGR